MKQKIRKDTIKKIISDKVVFNMTIRDLAEENGISTATATRVLQMYKLVSSEDWDSVREAIKSETQNKGYYAEPIAEIIGKMIPEDCYPKKEEPKPEPKQEPVKANMDGENSALFLTQLMQAQLDAQTKQKLFNQEILVAIKKQNELLESLLDVVFPHWFADLKDNVNTNSDLVCERLKEICQTLDGIKCNTRRRGA